MPASSIRSRLVFIFALVAAAAAVAPSLRAAMPAHRIPVVLDTDIGTDIDDTWALAYLLRSPELDLKLVVSDTGDTHYRAKIAAKLLQIAGRSDVAVGVGKDFSPVDERDNNLAPWVAGYQLAGYPGKVHEDGIGALIDTVMKSTETVTIIAIGAVPNIAIALQREPKIAAKCRFVGMHGSIDVGYGGKPPPSAESNVKVDPASLRIVLAAPWQDVLLTPLDTCGIVGLEGTRYQAVLTAAKNDPLVGAVIESYRVFAPRVRWMKCDFVEVRSTTLFDCVAVYLATSEEFVTTEKLHLRVTDDGFTVRDPAGPAARVALRWKSLEGFEDRLVAGLTGQTAK
jgi:inosine-uridine nucleoside N-ribohydrolase